MRISDWSSDVCSSDLHSIIIGGRFHPARIVELLKGLGDGGLVGDRHHAHPAAEHTHLVDGVEALRAAGDLHHRECPALRWPYRADRKGNPVDLRLHHRARSEEHTSELQSLMRISYAVFCLKKQNTQNTDV